MTTQTASSSPRPRLVIQVGVTGHRPNRLKDAMTGVLAQQCTGTLKMIAARVEQAYDPLLYSAEPPLVRILSPLAEGADRIVAMAGLALGMDLQCPLPFHADEYSHDFESNGSKEEFFALLSRASAVFELNGTRKAEEIAYERAGRMVQEQSDFLIAIWDGEPAAGRGGTPQMIEEAIARHLPVIWLNATTESDPQLLLKDATGKRASQPLAEKELPIAAVFISTGSSGKAATSFSHEYYAEKHPRFDAGRLFRIFRNLVAHGSVKSGSWNISDFATSARTEWTLMIDKATDLPAATKQYLLDKLCPYYAWADGLSVHYAGLLRSGAMLTNLLSALAVMVPMIGLLYSWRRVPTHGIPSLVEFVLIGIILAITHYGQRRKWHERWLNYRQLAELLRQYSYLSPLGSPLTAPRLPAHFGADPNRPWVDGTFRMIARDLGLAPAVITNDYVAAVGQLIGDILKGQIDFHDRNFKTMKKLSHRLHHAGTALFVITLVSCAAHVLLDYILDEQLMTNVTAEFLFLAVVPPAFGAAFYAIVNHGEFARSADRSHAMSAELVSFQERDLANALASPDDSFTALRQAAHHIAETLIAETMDWSFVYRYRTLNLPG